MQLKVDKILSKFDWNEALGPSGLRNGHLGLWTGAFAPLSTYTTVENLEKLISDMANDKLPPWFMQVLQGEDLQAIMKTERQGSRKADYTPEDVPNTILMVADKAMVKEFEDVYKSELMPQHVGVGVKFDAGPLAMDMRMTLHVHDTFALIGIDLKNACHAMRRATLCEAHPRHDKSRRSIPYRRAKLGLHSHVWAGNEAFWGEDGLNQGSPSSSSGFSWTIHESSSRQTHDWRRTEDA